MTYPNFYCDFGGEQRLEWNPNAQSSLGEHLFIFICMLMLDMMHSSRWQGTEIRVHEDELDSGCVGRGWAQLSKKKMRAQLGERLLCESHFVM